MASKPYYLMHTVVFADEFEEDFASLSTDVQDELLAQLRVVEQFGPLAKRPRVDTLKGSKHKNMKELRFAAADGEWRVAFAFDTERQAVVLCSGDKSGGSERAFYKTLIRKADERFDAHLARLKAKKVERPQSKK
jgi:hypothetical protein